MHAHHNQDHHQGHAHGHGASSNKNILIALIINTLFTLLEFIGGYLIGSQAILSDAVHDLGDTISLGSAYYLEKYAKKSRSESYSYGYKRFSLLSALISSVVIISGSISILIYTALNFNNLSPPKGEYMLGFAVFGIVINSLAAFRLNMGNTQNEKVLTWHFVEDILGWVAVFIGGLLIIFFKLPYVDQVLAILISCFVSFNVIKHFIETIHLFLQGVPRNFSEENFMANIKQLEGVLDAHDLHIWSLDGEHNILSLHLILEETLKPNQIAFIKQQVRKQANQQGHFHITIETETENETCGDECD